MKQLDKIISALYLAKSDNRERMLSDLIVNVLYSINEPIEISDIIIFINGNFHLTPIHYEVNECLNLLIENNEIDIKENKYSLSEKSKERIHESVLRGQSDSTKRFGTFSLIVKDIFDGGVDENEIAELWTIFNEYLLECFMVFGRKAIDIFLPYKTDELSHDDDILVLAFSKLKNQKLLSIFKKIVVEYPNRLNEPELRYLTSLAARAEKFYSLGIEKNDYEKIKNLEIKDLIILVDTNILYSILDLNIHPENTAIFELIRVAKEKHVDLRIVYLPKTYSELQKVKTYLEKVIPNEVFKISQIKALINSDKLDAFSKKYYENKLKNSAIPHPSEKVYYAADFFKGQGIEIYNNRFPQLEDDAKYLNAKIAEYMDFQHYYNNLCDEKGYDFHLNKDDKKIEHDVFLREGIKILKSKYSEENELRFICLTLDRSLIHFDHYSLRQENYGTHKIINPNFILPSIFIKKIRAFIPISTNDYRKAFITSLTAPNFEKEDDKETILVQKSMTYFKNLGIEDEEIILSCIKRELFLDNLALHEKDHTSEEFIKSEISNEIDRIKKEKENLEISLKEHELKTSEILKEKEIEKKLISQQKENLELTLKEQELKTIKIIKAKEEEKITIAKEKDSIVSKLENSVAGKENTITDLENRIKTIEEERDIENKARKKEKIEHEHEIKILDWNSQKDQFITDKWNTEIPILRRNTAYTFLVLCVTLCPVITGFILKANENIITTIENYGINQWYVWGFLSLIFIIELFGRSYIFNKEKIKNGWNWFIAFFSKKKYNGIMNNKKIHYEELFIEANGKKPTLT